MLFGCTNGLYERLVLSGGIWQRALALLVSFNTIGGIWQRALALLVSFNTIGGIWQRALALLVSAARFLIQCLSTLRMHSVYARSACSHQ